MHGLAKEQNTPQAVFTPSAGEGGSKRLDSIDLVRGLVMVIMALDHTRNYFSRALLMESPEKFHFIDPVNLSETTPALFFTRWITHYCAPTFVFLAGTGAFLFRASGRTKRELSWFLLTRGLWLVFLELVVVHLSWNFSFDYRHVVNNHVSWDFGGGVLWAIGWCMVFMAGLIFLPTSAVATLGVALIAFHNLFDAVTAKDFGRLGWIWAILHSGERGEVSPPFYFQSGYTLLPWIGVMAAGYGLGALYLLDPRVRRKELLGLGIILTLLFVFLRYENLYGDVRDTSVPPNQAVDPAVIAGRPGPWANRDNALSTVMSFLNCQKYPPSLLFLLMTLGPAINALGLFDRPAGLIGRFFVVFGRVPLFFYLLHLPLIHAAAIGFDYAKFGKSPLVNQNVGGIKIQEMPAQYANDLPIVFAAWAAVVLFLFPICWWYAGIKKRHGKGLLSYL
jgi:uncharacterized membrane protein